MSFDSSKITYAVSIHFSQNINEIITSAVSSIAEVTGNRFIIENKIPPHVTIGAFHATKENEPELMQLVEDFSKNQKSGTVHFTEIGDFNGKVLFLKPEKDEFLSEINKRLHEILLPEFEKAENGYYLPDIWFPHTTIATRMTQTQLEKSSKIAETINLPLETEINEISVYQCSPFLELKRLSLNSKT